MEKFVITIVVIIALVEIAYIALIPFNIDKIANELENINKSLKRMADKEK